MDRRFEYGVTTIEFAFIGILFIFLILGILDFARMMALQQSLNFAAQQAVNIASKTPALAADFRLLDCSCNIVPGVPPQPSSIDCISLATPSPGVDPIENARSCTRLLRAKERLAQLAVNTAIGMMTAGSDSRADARLVRLVRFENVRAGQQYQLSADAALFRPGDYGYFAADAHHSQETITHPTYSTPLHTQSPPPTMSDLLRVHPFVTVLRARYDSIIPYIGEVTLTGRAESYFQMVLGGSVPPSSSSASSSSRSITSSTASTASSIPSSSSSSSGTSSSSSSSSSPPPQPCGSEPTATCYDGTGTPYPCPSCTSNPHCTWNVNGPECCDCSDGVEPD